MIHDRNIVCLASNWHDHPTSKHHVMRLLAERNRVVWVNFHGSRRPSLTRGDGRIILRRLRQVAAGAQSVAPGIDALTPLVIPYPESRTARFLNARILARQIRAALGRRERRPVQLWLFTPDMPELIELLRPERTVYYCVDEFSAFEGFNAELIAELERRTMAACDVVLASSATLYDQRRELHRNVHFVPHGVDFDHFAAATELSREEVPEDVRQLPRPVLGYFGLISHYVDLELIARAARRKSDWSFVLIGDARCDTSAVAGLSNVHLLGGRPYEDLPRYCRAFDVGLIPFRMNRLTRAVNPIKLREYLAAGLPVVSAPMPEVLRYAPAVRVAETLDEFLTACSQALAESGAEVRRSRQDMVRPESWRSRVEKISRIVDQPVAVDCGARAPSLTVG